MKNRLLFLGLIACLWFPSGCTLNEDENIDPDLDGSNPSNVRTYESESFKVGDWWIDIYIPSDYDSLEKYPIIYFNDGDIYTDVILALNSSDIRASIKVGIYGETSRAERFLAYHDEDVVAESGPYAPNAHVYSEAIIDDIMPFVEDKYSISRSQKALFGISLGGLHATWMAIKYPGVFDFIGAMSPSYWVSNKAILGENLKGLSQTKLYYDRGSREWRNHLSFISSLKAAGLEYGQSAFYYEVLGGDHNTTHWQSRVHIPAKIFIEGIGPFDVPSQLELLSYCAFDVRTNNEAPRLNPVVRYSNGIRFSVITEATYSITQGEASVAFDGTYTITDGNSFTVDASYEGLLSTATANVCD